MKIIKSCAEIQNFCNLARCEGKTIGFVPTMGFLHEGHLSLMRRSRAENDLSVISIFVNPTQFGPSEDYETYPRDLERDSKMAESVGVDLIFTPEVKDMYPNGFSTFVNVEGLTNKMCGISRPTHFRGVTTVVSKLFNLVRPNRAYFGQKDAQQAIVIKRMTEDLNFDIQIIVMPTVREQDGLAMSSRNKYLNAEERQAALVLSQSLFLAQRLIGQGRNDAKEIYNLIKNKISSEPLAKIDYIAIVNANNLEEADKIEKNTLVALAVFIGKTRLIDNIIIE
ncbi:MAG: pantoate--beta-alanine ligase [bacterium]